MAEPRIRAAVVLAAGRGSRMGSAGPKCLQLVAGKTILEWTQQALRASGVERILVLGGFEARALSVPRCELRINERWQQTNMVRTLQLADDWLSAAPALIVYGDGAYGLSVMARIVDRFRDGIAMPVDRRWLELWRLRFDDPLSDAERLATRNGRVVSIGGRASRLSEIDGQFMGLLAVAPRGWQRMASYLVETEAREGPAVVDRMDTTSMLARLVADGVRIECIDVDGGWCEFDSPDDIRAVEDALQTPGFSHDFRT